MHPYVAIDPKAVAALVDEHLPPVVRDIVAVYWAGPMLSSSVEDKELGAFQLSILLHSDNVTKHGNISDRDIGLALSVPDYEIISDLNHPILNNCRIVCVPRHISTVPPVLKAYAPLSPPYEPNMRRILERCHTLFAFRAVEIELFEIYSTVAAAQFVSVHTGHARNYHNSPSALIREYIELRCTTGCLLDVNCACRACLNELHNNCRRENSRQCNMLRQCLCGCVYCTTESVCMDAQGLCKNQNLLCFSRWEPPRAEP